MNREWRFDSLYTEIPENIKTLLQGKSFHFNTDVQDLYIWKENINGSYSTKSGFSWLLDQRANNYRDQTWSWIWKLPASENIKLFVWLAFHNSTPTLSVLNYRSISPTAVCNICQGEEETLLHCIRDCARVRRIWVSLGFIDSSFYQQTNVHIWLKHGATGPKDNLFLACIWWSWKSRNAKCFNNEDISHQRLLSSILNLADVLRACFNTGENASQPIRHVTWLQQDREGAILNVDGSSLGNPGPTGFGGLVRNPDGSWLFGFSGHVGISDVLKAELLGIYNGLKLAWDRGYRHLTCYTDSLIAKNLIVEHSDTYHIYATIIQDIRDLLDLPWRTELLHILREGNQCADHLAKMGAGDDANLRIFESPPLEMNLCLAADTAGVSFPRGYPRLN